MGFRSSTEQMRCKCFHTKTNYRCLELGLRPIYTYRRRHRLRHRPHQVDIVLIVTACLTGKMGVEPILSVRQAVTISIMLTFDGVGDRDGHGVGTYKQAFNFTAQKLIECGAFWCRFNKLSKTDSKTNYMCV